MFRAALSINEAARAAGVGRTTIFVELKAGRLLRRKVGRRTIILPDDLERWLKSLPCAPGASDGTLIVQHDHELPRHQDRDGKLSNQENGGKDA